MDKRFVFIFYILTYSAWGQNPYMKAVNYPYQLSAQGLYDLFKDSKEQIWIGSDRGLYRFNGKIAHILPSVGSLQSDITHLKEDKYGRIWGMNFARQVFYVQNDTLKALPIGKNDFEGTIINFDFTENQIWLGTSSGCVSYDLKTFEKRIFVKSEEIYTDFISFQNYFVGVAPHHLIYVKENGKSIFKETPLLYESRFCKAGNNLIVVENKLARRVGLKISSSLEERYFEFALDNDIFLFHLRPFSEKEVSLCTKQGIYLLDIEKFSLRTITNTKQVTGFIQDYQGSFWFATLNNGLWFCPSLEASYFSFPSENIDFSLKSVYTHKNHLYVGSGEGWIYQISKSNLRDWKSFEIESEGEIKKIVFSEKNIWAGASIFDFSGKKVASFLPFKDLAFLKKNNETYFLVALSYVARWVNSQKNDTSKEFFRIPIDLENSKREKKNIYDIRKQRSYAVAIDTLTKRYWVGYNDNLIEYDKEGKSKVIESPEKKPILGNHLLFYQGYLIVGTLQQGVFIFKKGELVVHFGENALKSTSIRKLSLQGERVWLGTDAEIGFINLQNFSFTDFLTNAGLGGLTYKDFCADEQALWLGLSKGLVKLPYTMHEGKNVLKMLTLRKLTHSEEEIVFEGEALNYQNPNGTQIHYRIREISEEWKNIQDNKALIIYNYLPYGRYTLEVFAEDFTLGVRSSLQSYVFEVPKKWWQTWWFRLGVLVFSFALIAFVLFLLFNRYRKRKELKEALWISQLKALHAQMNPHFLYNILYTIQALVYANKKTEAGHLLGSFSDLMRKILDASEKMYVDLGDEVAYLQLYLELEKVRLGQSFSYHIHLEAKNVYFIIPSMLLQPFVENALKHGLMHKKGEKILTIRIVERKQFLEVWIEDNGIGREKSGLINAKHKRNAGFSTQATQKRIDILNKMGKYKVLLEIIDKKDTEGNAEGTLVKLNIYNNEP